MPAPLIGRAGRDGELARLLRRPVFQVVNALQRLEDLGAGKGWLLARSASLATLGRMKSALVIVACLLLPHFLLSNMHARHPPGVLVAEEPAQTTATDKSWQKSGFTIRSLAQFHIRARVISTERYWFDEGSRLSPIDFMLGWGPMSDQSVLDQIAFRQGMRWCTYRPNGRNFPLPMDDINTHSANMHLIPSDKQVEAELKRVSLGDIVDMRGCLVQVEGANGWKWRSSLSRTDTGNGACELVWVDNVSASW